MRSFNHPRRPMSLARAAAACEDGLKVSEAQCAHFGYAAHQELTQTRRCAYRVDERGREAVYARQDLRGLDLERRQRLASRLVSVQIGDELCVLCLAMDSDAGRACPRSRR